MNLTLEESEQEPTDFEWVKAWRNELDLYYAGMRKFNDWASYEVLQALSSMSARASEIRTQLVRHDTRRFTAFRTKELDPFLEEVDRQFKIHSRIQSIREMEFKMSSGGAF